MAFPKDRLPPAAAKLSVDSAWADGLRGIASLFVVSSHLTLCFARSIVPPSFGQDGPSMLFQRPIFRLIGQGNAAVAIFFVMLGFVNSLKAIQQSRSGNVKDALSGLANSSFRRTGRLVFPAAAITVISWFLCQLGFLKLSGQSDAFWLLATTPAQSLSWFQAVKDLFHELIYTWVHAENRYDQPQWALLHLFRGSMCTYMVLLATCNATPAFRLGAVTILYIWSWISNESIVLFNVFAGMLLAELAYILPSNRPKTHLKQTPSYALAILGLYLASYPDNFAQQTPWSNQLLTIGLKIFPTNSMLGRYWPGLGAQLLCLAIVTSPSMRHALSHRYLLWLGGLSYSLYLLHGTFIRTIMTYLIFGPMYLSPRIIKEDLSPDPLVAQPSAPILIVELAVFSTVMMAGVHAWSVKVEPYFARMTARLDALARTWGAGYRGWSGGGGLAARGNWSRGMENGNGNGHANGHSNGNLNGNGSVLPVSVRRD